MWRGVGEDDGGRNLGKRDGWREGRSGREGRRGGKEGGLEEGRIRKVNEGKGARRGNKTTERRNREKTREEEKE